MNLGYIREALRSDIVVDSHPAAKKAAVLVAIYGDTPYLIMTKKSRHLGIHAGEIAFPGGKAEDTDSDLLDTALRETREEISLDVRRSDVISALGPVSTLNTGFLIFPFVAALESLPRLSASGEVESILYIPLEPFLGTMEPDARHGPDMYRFLFESHIVWGASARILGELRSLLR